MSNPLEHAIVTQEDVARAAGVSRAIVSYVLNNGPRKVSEETRARVLKAIDDLGYRPNQHAQRLKLGMGAALNSIGIVAGGKGFDLLERPYYTVILAGLFDGAHQMRQQIRFFTFFENLKDPVFFNKNIHREEISSLILIHPKLILDDPEHDKTLRHMIERVDNILCLETSIYNLPSLVVDLAAAAQMATEHLISLGHQKIGFLSLRDERDQGYQRALLMHNIPFDPSLVRSVAGEKMIASATTQAIDLIESRPDLTALVASNDESAIAAMAVLRDHGLTVPDDVAVASIDNIELAGVVRPALTTVNIPRRDMVDYALRLVVSARDNPMFPSASVMMPIELIVRESCGAKRQERA